MTKNENWKTGVIWKVENHQLVPKKIKVGLSDGSFTEIESMDFTENDQVVIGLIDASKASRSSNTNPFIPSRPGGDKKG